ncbi:MAG TPA: hypothetical protein VH539_10715, partial [Gemmatimonadaceae bacterium]
MNTPNRPRDIDQSTRPRPATDIPGQAPLMRAPDEAPLTPVPEERRIFAFMGEVRRVGRWLVPRTFRVRAFLGEVKVDLRENLIPEGFTFDARAYGSRVTLI